MVGHEIQAINNPFLVILAEPESRVSKTASHRSEDDAFIRDL